jgi:hypothetical protein
MPLARILFVLTCIAATNSWARVSPSQSCEPNLTFQIQVETILKHDDGQFLWYHPRAVVYPDPQTKEPLALLTLQKHLRISDYYSGLFAMHSDATGKTWAPPEEIPELAWRQAGEHVTVAVADVTPGWHAPTGKVLAIGAQVRYSPKGLQLEDQPRAHQTAYSVYDPTRKNWTRWQELAMPQEEKFNFCRCACSQWLVQADGTLLLPLYIGKNARDPFQVTVARCRFDGHHLIYAAHGTELSLPVVRGLCEPSLAFFQGKYYLTLRNDLKAYVAVSDDGLHFGPVRPWLFDDGMELGSYNTQQHWLCHSDGLFLVYTRKGAGNDHIIRHRAPLFIAEVDSKSLRIKRQTEQVLISERGGEMGNFGACPVSPRESWVTVAEGVWSDQARRRGAQGATFLARVIWSQPNRQVQKTKE